MIIRSLLRCSGTKGSTIAPKSPNSTFYSRFYSVMNAMQVHEEPESTEHVRTEVIRRRPAMTNVPGLPGGKRLANETSFKSEAILDIEEGLGGLSSMLISLEGATTRSRRRLGAIYEARARRRDALRHTSTPDNSKYWKHDEEYVALTQDAERLEKTMLSVRQNLSQDKFRASSYAPDIRSVRANAPTLDSRVQNLLRLPCPGQLGALARILSTTKVSPSVKTFNIMISRLTRLRQNAAAWIVFQTMLKLKLTPDEHTISSVLNLSIVSGSYADFRKVIMASRRQQRIDKANDPDRKRHYRNRRGVILFSTIIKGCIKFGHLRRAETYITLMRAERARPNMQILTAIIQAYADKGDWLSGKKHFEKIMSMEWDRKTVATLIHYCKVCGQPAHEEQVRRLAKMKGIERENERDDLASLPRHWKTKGLDVPNHFKMPKAGDIGALNRKNERGLVVSDFEYRSKKNNTEGTSGRVFTGTRREALGKWGIAKA